MRGNPHDDQAHIARERQAHGASDHHESKIVADLVKGLQEIPKLPVPAVCKTSRF